MASISRAASAPDHASSRGVGKRDLFRSLVTSKTQSHLHVLRQLTNAAHTHPAFDASLEISRMGRAEAHSSHPNFDLLPQSHVACLEAHGTPSQFEDALEESRAARLAAVQAVSDQQVLLDRLFPKDSNDMKGSARALIVASTKAIRALLQTSEGLEVEALGMRRSMARSHLTTIENTDAANRQSVRSLRASHDVALAALTSDLAVAEVIDKEECRRMQDRLNGTLRREREANARVAEKAASQAAGHSITVRELEEAMDTHRTEMHTQLDAVRAQLRASEDARRQLESERIHEQLELDRVNAERVRMATVLGDQLERSERAWDTVRELEGSHRAACMHAAALEDRVEQTEAYTSHTQAVMAHRMANMHRMQAWALASSSARALEMKGVRQIANEERGARHGLALERSASQERGLDFEDMGAAATLARAHSAAQMFTPRSCSRSPSSQPSARHATRTRARLYSDMTKARAEAYSPAYRVSDRHEHGY